MSDVLVNFTTKWPSIQIAKVLTSLTTSSRYAHNLGYPPFAIGVGSVYDVMDGVTVDETYVYTDAVYSTSLWDYIVVYGIDISTPDSFPVDNTVYGTATEDTSGGLDLSQFLFHSGAGGPMVLDVTTSAYPVSFTSGLSYSTFQFGWDKLADGSSWAGNTVGSNAWQSAPLAGQAPPTTDSNGYTATVTGLGTHGAILTLRNPSVVTLNTTAVTV